MNNLVNELGESLKEKPPYTRGELEWMLYRNHVDEMEQLLEKENPSPEKPVRGWEKGVE